MYKVQIMTVENYNKMMCGETGYNMRTITIVALNEEDAVAQAELLYPDYYINKHYVEKIS